MNEIGRCKTCKHWASEIPCWGGDGKYMKQADYGGGFCQSTKIAESPGEYEPDMLVYPYDEGGCFWTGPEFGCVHHEAKQ